MEADGELLGQLATELRNRIYDNFAESVFDPTENEYGKIAPHQDRVGFMHRSTFQRTGRTVTAAAQSLANDTYFHFNDPKFEPCVWPDLYPGGVGGYNVGCGIGCGAYYRSRYLAFDENWRRDRWWSFFNLFGTSKISKRNVVIAQRISLRNICLLLKALQDPSPLQSNTHHIKHNLVRNPLNHPVSRANQLHVQVPNHPHSPRANHANHQHAPHTNRRRPVLHTKMV